MTDHSSTPHYPQVDANPDFAALEREVLAYWRENGTFERSVENRPAKVAGENNEYIFYDGPPFANGLPHYGHLLTGYVKDLFARYHTMKGERTERRFGWDCHGLPAEMGAEKELGVSGRANIEKFGIQKFNDYCRTSVMKYTGEWEEYVTRQARWVDFQNDYKTMDTPYMESVMWAFSELHKKGLVYESHRVMPYSWAMETPVSNFETRMDNSYREREDKAITVAFKLKEPPKGAPEADEYYVLAWTTTPWTLPSNLALAASADMLYMAIKREDKVYILAQSSLGAYEFLGADTTTFAEFNGKNLIGLTYEPLFPYFKNHPNSFRILDGSDFIEEGSGTGIVHMAPGFGEDDQRVCAANGIALIVPVDERGCYTDAIFDLPQAYIETERLYARPFKEEEYHLFEELETDPGTVSRMAAGVMTQEQIKAEFARFQRDQESRGYTQWAVFTKEDNTFIGRSGFDHRNFAQPKTTNPERIELRYAFKAASWGKGYAGEINEAMMLWAAANTQAIEADAGTFGDNTASRRILDRLGFKHIDVVRFKGKDIDYYLADLQPWRQKTEAQPALSLKGLNVVADTRKNADEPYKEEQLKKYGLANLRIIRWLKDTGRLIKDDKYIHNYPHCWRTDTPLIYRALPSWYVEVSKFAPRMVELNEQINWIPEHIKHGRFGKWLEGARDWSISRNRYWGSPIPVWKNDKDDEIKVFGSIAELEAFFGVKVDDLHRPFIDSLVKEESGPNGVMRTWRRVTDVFDCWFESGSMPYAQVHYPFENKEWFETHFPADFIVEYEAQTRGWFYTLMVLSTALFDKPPFKNCICHGVVMSNEKDENGHYHKLSKRLRNYPDPMKVFEEYGADALRWFMMSSPVMRGQEMYIDKEGKFIRDAVRLYIKPIWNAYNFFTLYANADGVKARFSFDSTNLMDRYILSKLTEAVKGVEAGLDAYDTPSACQAVTDLFEVLNNWYIRRNKDRFWKKEKDEDKQTAYNTLFTALHVMMRAASPLLPLLSEQIYRGLTGEESVHLADFPSAEVAIFTADAELIRAMDFARDVCNVALSIRNKNNIRVRQPLQTLSLKPNPLLLDSKASIAAIWRVLAEVIKDEVNVEEVLSGTDAAEFAAFANVVLLPNLPVIGKSRPAIVKEVMAAAKQGKWEKQDNGKVLVGGHVLAEGEYLIRVEPKEEFKASAQAISSNDALVVLDLSLNEGLIQKGIARDVVRMIQQARKDADLHISDRIRITLDLPEDMAKAVEQHKAYIAEQTLADSLSIGTSADAAFRFEHMWDDKPVVVAFSPIKAAA